MKREQQIVDAARRMFKADSDYGCGFYSDERWIDAYRELADLVGLEIDWLNDKWRLKDEQQTSGT